MSGTLYLFTSSFPYGQRESFIENEILFLSKSFDHVSIVPLCFYKKTGQVRKTPPNVEIVNPIIHSRWQHYFIGLFCTRSVLRYAHDFIKSRIYTRAEWLKMFYIDFCTTNNLLQSRTLKGIIRKADRNDVAYFYWGKGSSNILPFIALKAKKIVRFHRGDLYDFIFGGYIPIQRQIIEKIDVAVFISQHGEKYFKEKYKTLAIKSQVHYLGTIDHGISKRSNDSIFRVVSCSSVIPVKRVFLLLDALETYNEGKVEWTHIGAGPDFERLKIRTQQFSGNLKVNLPGQISNQDVISYYKQNMIDVFVNVSASEGLPVSIMEAISFNIPVIATDVGGTPEIVKPECGILLKAEPTVFDITEALKMIRQRTELEPRKFWEKNFNSDINYPNFINQVLIK
jgi:glycosyltransferase involved in cell wall biosynthesis